MAEIHGDIIEVLEKEVDDYGRVGVGKKHAQKNVKIVLVEVE